VLVMESLTPGDKQFPDTKRCTQCTCGGCYVRGMNRILLCTKLLETATATKILILPFRTTIDRYIPWNVSYLGLLHDRYCIHILVVTVLTVHPMPSSSGHNSSHNKQQMGGIWLSLLKMKYGWYGNVHVNLLYYLIRLLLSFDQYSKKNNEIQQPQLYYCFYYWYCCCCCSCCM